MTDLAVSTAMPLYESHGDGHGDGHHGDTSGPRDTVEVQAGRDVVIGYVEAEPGFSAGWNRHTAGQSWHHPTHTHLPVNEGNDTLKFYGIYVNVPPAAPSRCRSTETRWTRSPSPLPPADCPRLR